jgi:hypothetical protein
MNESETNELKKLLKDSLPPMQGAELRRDLWPEMQRRLDRRAFNVPWWDWALLAGVTAFFSLFPGLLPALLYHL